MTAELAALIGAVSLGSVMRRFRAGSAPLGDVEPDATPVDDDMVNVRLLIHDALEAAVYAIYPDRAETALSAPVILRAAGAAEERAPHHGSVHRRATLGIHAIGADAAANDALSSIHAVAVDYLADGACGRIALGAAGADDRHLWASNYMMARATSHAAAEQPSTADIAVAEATVAAFAALGLEVTASASQIKLAFRDLARTRHPDVVPPVRRERAAEEFIVLSRCRDVAMSHATRRP